MSASSGFLASKFGVADRAYMVPIAMACWIGVFAACSIGAGCGLAFSLLAASIISTFICVPLFSSDFLQPAMFLCTYTLLGTLDIVFAATGVESVSTTHAEETYTKSLALVAIWLVSFLISYWLCGRSGLHGADSSRSRLTRSSGADIDYAYGFIIAVVLVVVFLSVFQALKASMRLGGIVQGMLYGGAAFEDQGYLMQLLALAGIAPIALLHIGKNKTAVFTAAVIFLSIALTGRRSLTLIAVAIPFLIYYNYRVKKISGFQIAVAGLGAVLFILLIGSIRTASEANRTQAGSLLEAFASLTSYVGYGRNLPDLIASMDSGLIPFQGSAYLLRGIQYFIPRAIWPEKPLVHSSDIVSSILYFEGDVGRPVGPYGWSYFCFGFAGVAVAGVISGYLAKRMYLWMLRDKSVFRLMFYSSSIFSILEVVTPESQMKIIFCAAVIWMFAFLSRRKTRASHVNDRAGENRASSKVNSLGARGSDSTPCEQVSKMGGVL